MTSRAPISEQAHEPDLRVRWIDDAGREIDAPDAALAIGEADEREPIPADRSILGRQSWKGSRISGWREAARRGELRLLLRDFLPAPVEVRLSPESDASATYELALPPHGEVIFRLDDRGLALPRKLQVALEAWAENTSKPEEGHQIFRGLDQPLAVRVLCGAASFDFAAAFRGVSLRSTGRFEAPKFPGEIRYVDLRVGAGAPVLAGLLCDEANAPLGKRRVVATWSPTDHPRSSARLTIFEDGRFAWTPPRLQATAQRGTLRLQTDSGWAAERAEIELPTEGVIELGAMRLEPPDEHLKGRVLDARGAPLNRASVVIEPLLGVAGAAPDEPEYTASHRSELRTDELGRFAWKLPAKPRQWSALRISASKGFSSCAPKILPASTTEVELRLELSGSLRGRVELGDLAVMVRLELHPASAARVRSAPLASELISKSRNFELKDLAAGTYDLTVDLLDIERNVVDPSICVVRGLTVPSDGVGEDPRLDPLDLREHLCLYAFELRGVPEVSTEHSSAWTRLSNAPQSEWKRMHSAFAQPSRWVLSRRPHDFRFTVRGYRRAEVKGALAGSVIELQPLLRVRLRVEGSRGEALEAVLLDDPNTYLLVVHMEGEIYDVLVHIPGELRVWQECDSSEKGENRATTKIIAATVTVADRADLQEIHVQLR